MFQYSINYYAYINSGIDYKNDEEKSKIHIHTEQTTGQEG